MSKGSERLPDARPSDLPAFKGQFQQGGVLGCVHRPSPAASSVARRKGNVRSWLLLGGLLSTCLAMWVGIYLLLRLAFG
jgi:hypothetical protein